MSHKEKQELTKEQIERQDVVDNAINDLINELLEPQGIAIDWNIATISTAREAIVEAVSDHLNYAGEKKEQFEMAFYPYIITQYNNIEEKV